MYALYHRDSKKRLSFLIRPSSWVVSSCRDSVSRCLLASSWASGNAKNATMFRGISISITGQRASFKLTTLACTCFSWSSFEAKWSVSTVAWPDGVCAVTTCSCGAFWCYMVRHHSKHASLEKYQHHPIKKSDQVQLGRLLRDILDVETLILRI